MKHDQAGRDRLKAFIAEAHGVAARFAGAVRRAPIAATIVHHNDADGLAAAAALAYALDRLDLERGLLPVEKVHAPVVAQIHAMAQGAVIYADLGGQSCGLIGRYATDDQEVIILDHHLPGEAVSGRVSHLNPELYGISGDADASGAAVCAVFAAALMEEAARTARGEGALPALMGVIGAVGDGQMKSGALTGVNRILLEAAVKQGEITPSEGGYAIPRFGNKSPGEIVAVLNLLGSVGFYSGGAKTAVDFLLGGDPREALRTADQLQDLMAAAFNWEAETIRRTGLAASPHFQWVDVKRRFEPMGVKAIGLFLEYLVEQGLAALDKYVIGFQHLPAEMPGLGFIQGSLTKISARVPPNLRASIQQGRLPDFLTLIPLATEQVQGTADGCHRFAAASLIAQGREAEFLQALEQVLAQKR
jgi:hypothetical protein